MNNNNNSTTVRSGIGFTGVLQIVFIVLKLLDKIDWSWFWVLAPTWIPVGLAVGIIAIVIIIGIITGVIQDRSKKRK